MEIPRAGSWMNKRVPRVSLFTLALFVLVVPFALQRVVRVEGEGEGEGGEAGMAGRGEREEGEEVLALPDSEEAVGSTSIPVNEGHVSLVDSLGPLVVQEDGRLQRITNWAKMTEEEKKRTVRIITKRNRERLQRLRLAEGWTAPQEVGEPPAEARQELR